MRKPFLFVALAVFAASSVINAEYHVSVSGNDQADGSAQRPFRTIQRAADVAHPGDVITVHEGEYRERVTPPRGGTADDRRIVYQAAPGERVVIKGSEVARDWKPFAPGVWKLTLPNSFFGKYNPYKDRIFGDWFDDRRRPHHTGEVYLNGKSLWETHLIERVLNPRPMPGAADAEGSTWTWFCEVDEQNTYIYANFHDRDPNKELVEINVRDSCFYPEKPGCNYITVRGFRMCHAATQWAAPTAEQIGLIGTHWSKGWTIENNVISDSKCSGITLGKDRATGHNVWRNDPCKDGALHYNEVIQRALAAGWSRDTIGSHIVRNNVIFDCEQTGICGSLGPVFSTITGNHICNIWRKRQFTGAEMAGIKLHAAIDVVIRGNLIHDCGRGLWMDWMAQGTRISGNLLYNNSTDDLFVEVNHGPFLVDNNVFLSPLNVRDWSQGGAFVHNLFVGRFDVRPELNRQTPYHEAHSTGVAGLSNIPGGDHRFYNNIFFGGAAPEKAAANQPIPAKPQRSPIRGLSVYDASHFPVSAAGNVYCGAAQPLSREEGPIVLPKNTDVPSVVREQNTTWLVVRFPEEARLAKTVWVATELLGKAKLPGTLFENPDGSALKIDHDYFGKPRSGERPAVGPFAAWGNDSDRWKMW